MAHAWLMNIVRSLIMHAASLSENVGSKGQNNDIYILISLKEIKASTKSNKGGIDESCSTVLLDDKTQSDALSVSSGSTSPSYHSSSYSPSGPNITQWFELVSNFQPDTPQLFDQNGDNVNSGLLQQAFEQLATFESDLANIRKEKHSKWLSDIFRKEKFRSGTKEGQELREQTVIDSELLTRMVQNSNNLLKSLDFKGIFSLLKSQIDKTEKLHVTIQNIREEYFDLRN